MQLIRIDPQTRRVEYIESTGKLADLCRLIDCRVIDVCARQHNGDALTVDDEALFLDPQPAAFTYGGFGPIHGIGLLTGCDEEGETTEPQTTLDKAVQEIEWLGAIYTQPGFTIITF